MSIKFTAKKLCVVAMLTALNVILSSFRIPVPGGGFYLNDIVICFAALFLDPISAFAVGGIGAFLGDFFFYQTTMFISLGVRGVQAVSVSLISGGYKAEKLNIARSVIAVSVGAIIMIAGYSLCRAFIYSTPEYALTKLPFQILQAVAGAAQGTSLCFVPPINKLLLTVK